MPAKKTAPPPEQPEPAAERLADAVRRDGAPEGLSSEARSRAARRLDRAAESARAVLPGLARDLETAARKLESLPGKEAAQALLQVSRRISRTGRRMERLKLLKGALEEAARLKEAIRAGGPVEGNRRWAVLFEEVPEEMRRRVLPTVAGTFQGRGPTGIGTADVQPGAGGTPARRIPGRRVPVRVAGRPGATGEAVVRIVRGVAREGAASVGYSEVFARYAPLAEAAAAGEEVPLGYRFYVRRYFQAIRPR